MGRTTAKTPGAAKRRQRRDPTVAITLDIDWAPDFVVDHVAALLIECGVKATWFVTHQSPAVNRLRHEGLFELGIHPNLLPGSSHGKTPDEVMAFCQELVPDARSMRTHGLVQSSAFLCSVLAAGRIARDVSLFLPYHRGLRPVPVRTAGQELWRLPYFWEDDVEMEQPEPDWDICRLLSNHDGLAIFDFHPIHIFLNSASMAPYQSIKAAVGNLLRADRETVTRFVATSAGAGTAFGALVRHLAHEKTPTWKIAEIELTAPASVQGGAA